MTDIEYYTALICKNGHVRSEMLEKEAHPESYCKDCGAKTISSCQNCGAHIRGEYKNSMVLTLHTMDAPKYCIECGEPYPWTKEAIDAVLELAELDEKLNEDDVESLESSATDIIADTPKTKVAIVRVKHILSKAGEVTASAIRDILVNVASETAKKMLLG